MSEPEDWVDQQQFIIPCPNCGTTARTEYVDLRNSNGMVSIMCWSNCGMDFDVNGIWFMLNRIARD